MGGGLINIVSYGFNDLYLTGSPQITFFKVVYRRHTNFSRESIILPIGNINFNSEATVNFQKIGDLISNTFLQFTVPEIYLLKTDLATDLTNAQIKALTTPSEISMPSSEIDIANNYDTVLKFIKINTAGYRVALDNQNIKNQSVSDFVSTITNVLQYTGEDENYKNALTNAYLFEKNAGNYESTSFLDSRFSDIKSILSLTDLIVDNTVTVSNVMNLINDAMDTCIKVKKYFFLKAQKKYKLEKDASSLYAKYAWVKRIGFAMIDRVDISIGGERIDRHYGDWMNLWYELTSDTNQDKLYDELLGNVDILTTFDRNKKPKYVITIPLNFWFCKRFGLAFPLIALQYNQISLTVKLKKIEECAYVEKLPELDQQNVPLNINQISLTDVWENQGLSIEANMLVEYIYLDSLERKRFAQSAHEYLIETIEMQSIENIMDSNVSFNLDFTGPSKELIWHVQKNIYNSDESTYIKYPFFYGLDNNRNVAFNNRKQLNTIIKTQLLLNSKERFNYSSNEYFNILQPMFHHTRYPSQGINLYSFCLYPEEHQPSGSCNFTVISNPTMSFEINSDMFKYLLSDVDTSISIGSEDDQVNETNLTAKIYSVKYNVLRLIGGFGAFAYSYTAK